WLGIHENQIFLGYGKHEALKFRVKNLTIYLGLFIPLPWLAKFYSYENGVKNRIRLEWEYDAPWIKRLLVTFGGTVGSLLASMIIFSILAYQEVDQFVSKEELNKYGIYPSQFARSTGFQKGDKIISINGETNYKYEELIAPNVLLGDPAYQILRDKDTLDIQIALNFSENEGAEFMLYPNAPCEVNYILPGKPANRTGLISGDIITHIESNEVNSLEEIKEKLKIYSGDEVQVKFNRNGDLDTLRVEVLSDGTIGFVATSLVEFTHSSKSIGVSLKEGVTMPFTLVMLNIRGLSKLLGGEDQVNRKVSGPIRIASLYTNSATRFFRISALFMAILAFWDLMPFPKSAILKSFPIIWEVLTKNKIAYKSFKNIQRVGWYIIAALMAITIMNDILMIL
ncbi:PDZ domain-containing protein, partial [Reichenbachiella sp.]|uniref:PDZ domain-containing protein n=2 Tax=Reichenbachiella sp. TaxID=2184521 RepID=UPI0032969619